MKILSLLFLIGISFTVSAQIQLNRPIELIGSGSDAKITGIKSVTDSLDAANKAYVDSVAASLLDSILANSGGGGPTWVAYSPSSVIGTYNTSFNGQQTYSPSVVNSGYIQDGKMIHYKVTLSVPNPNCCGNQNYQLLYIDLDLPQTMANIDQFVPGGAHDTYLGGSTTPSSSDIIRVYPTSTTTLRITYGHGDSSLYRWPNNQSGTMELTFGFSYMAQ